jgi:hypothetical protein
MGLNLFPIYFPIENSDSGTGRKEKEKKNRKGKDKENGSVSSSETPPPPPPNEISPPPHAVVSAGLTTWWVLKLCEVPGIWLRRTDKIKLAFSALLHQYLWFQVVFGCLN